MAKPHVWALSLAFLLLGGAAELRAQYLADDPPLPFVPRRAESRRDLDRREARKLYAQALVCQHDDRLLEALRQLEQACQLDPQAPQLRRALVPLYLALGRDNDAMAACRKALDIEPGDFETWYALARQLKDRGQTKEAIDALEHGAACPSARDELDILVQVYFDLGNLYQDARAYDKAESAFREVAKILVDHREALLESGPYEMDQVEQETAKTYERIGDVCTMAGKYDRAVSAYREAQKRDPNRATRLSYHLAEVHLAQAKPREALRQLDLYLRSQPQGAEAYELKIAILKKLHREADILPALEEAAGRDEYNIPLHLLLARRYAEEKRATESERLYGKLAETNPSVEVYRGLFTLHKDQATTGKVLDLLDRTLRAAATKDDGDDDDQAAVYSPKAAAAAARARCMLPVLRADAGLVKAMLKDAERDLLQQKPRYRTTMRLLAVLATRQRQTAIAEQLYRACLPTITQQTEAEIYSGLLDALMEQHKYQDVVDVCKEGQKKAQVTNLILFQAKLAPAFLHLGKTDEAVAAMDEAVKLADDGNRLGVQRMRMAILCDADKHDQAVKECEALLQQYSRPGDVRDIRHMLSNIYSTAKEFAKAEEQLRLILEANPDDATANNDLGYIMADQGKNLEESERLVRKALDLDIAEKKQGKVGGTEGEEGNPAYIDSLGWVLFRQGKLPEARQQLEKAVRLMEGEDDPVVWDHLGDVYFRLDQAKEARAAWDKAAGLYDLEKRRKPDERYQEIKHKLENLGPESPAR